MERKTDWIKGASGDIVRRLEEREESALDYKRYLLRSMDTCMVMCCCMDHPACTLAHVYLCWVQDDGGQS